MDRATVSQVLTLVTDLHGCAKAPNAQYEEGWENALRAVTEYVTNMENQHMAEMAADECECNDFGIPESIRGNLDE